MLIYVKSLDISFAIIFKLLNPVGALVPKVHVYFLLILHWHLTSILNNLQDNFKYFQELNFS